jgi:hypothetical protein
MRLSRLAAGAVAIALLIAPSVARATPACGGSTFATCASVNVTKTLLSNGNVRIRIEVLNQAGLAGTYERTTITRVGLWGLSDSARYVAGSLTVGGEAVETDWRLASLSAEDDSIPKERRMRQDLRGVRLRQGIPLGLTQKQPASFEFDITGISIDEINIRNWELHAEAQDGSCATDMVAREGTLSEARSSSALCTALVTPEPSTLLFLTTGLAGLSGLQWVRRRRKHGLSS